jgi:flavorubredoxin
MVDIIEIRDGVFALTEPLPENMISVSSFLITGERPTVIETGTPYLANGFLRTISDMVAPETISYIFVTHEHFDHIGGISEYVSEAYNANVVAHSFLRVQLGFIGVVRGLMPVNGGETIPIGKRTIEVVYVPVETTGTVVYLLRPDGILFSGDYFGQLYEGKQTQSSEGSIERLIRNIVTLHEGLGLRADDIKRYLSPLEKKKIEIIAPTHGHIIKDNVSEVFHKVVNAKLDYREGVNALRRLTGR